MNKKKSDDVDDAADAGADDAAEKERGEDGDPNSEIYSIVFCGIEVGFVVAEEEGGGEGGEKKNVCTVTSISAATELLRGATEVDGVPLLGI